MPAGAVVADGVVAQVGDQLGQHIAAAQHRGGRVLAQQRDIRLAGVHGHGRAHIPRQHAQVQRRALGRGAALRLLHAVQLRKLQDVRHQADHAPGFAVDALAEHRHVGGFGHAGLQQLRKAGDAGQRRFQLVADVGRELPAHGFVVFAQAAVGLDRMRQRDQLLIRHVGLDGVEVFGHGRDRPHKPPRQPEADGPRRQQHDRPAARQQRQHAVVAGPHAGSFFGQAQDLAVFHAQRIVMRLGAQGGAFAHAAALARLQRFADLRAGEVVVHVGLVFVLAVKQHAAVGVDQRQAQRAARQVPGQAFGVGRFGGLIADGHGAGHALEVAVHLHAVGAVEQHGRGRGREHHGQQANGHQRALDAARHALRGRAGRLFRSHRRPHRLPRFPVRGR